LIGTHGTCGAYADSIDSEGFKPSGGWRGTGVYFWECDPDQPHIAEMLGRLWWENRNNQNRWPEGDDECVVFSVKIPDNVTSLNMRDISQRRMFFDFAAKYQAKVGGSLALEHKCAIFDEYLSILQRRGNCTISLVKSEDKTPFVGRIELPHLLDAHRCVTVLDRDCISDIERLECHGI